MDIPKKYPTVGDMLWDEFIAPLGMSIEEVSQKTAISIEALSGIIAGSKLIDTEESSKLAKLFEVHDTFWLDIQKQINTLKPMWEVWRDPPRGQCWCDCDDNHELTPEIIEKSAKKILRNKTPDTLTHRQVILIAMQLWNYEEICEFFLLAITEAAKQVNGQECAEYSYNMGIAIIKSFSNHWQGCPMEVYKECNYGLKSKDIRSGKLEKVNYQSAILELENLKSTNRTPKKENINI